MNGWNSYRAWALVSLVENDKPRLDRVSYFLKNKKFDIESLANFVRTEFFPSGVMGHIDLEDLTCKDWQEVADHWNSKQFTSTF